MSKEREDSVKDLQDLKEEVLEDEDIKAEDKKEVQEEVEEEVTHVFEEGVDKTEDIPEDQESNYGL